MNDERIPNTGKNLAGWIGFRLPRGEPKSPPSLDRTRPAGFDRSGWPMARPVAHCPGRAWGSHTVKAVWATVSGYPTRHTLRRAEAAYTNPQVATGFDQNGWTTHGGISVPLGRRGRQGSSISFEIGMAGVDSSRYDEYSSSAHAIASSDELTTRTRAIPYSS